ncbi:MAG: helix-turn-helix domain-containing protein, partial [Pseudomonadota bacterium]
MEYKNEIPLAEAVAAVRRFNRFYTRHVGALDEAHLDSPFSLAEARVLYELSVTPGTTATALRERLNMDAAYLSRLLKVDLSRKSAAPCDHVSCRKGDQRWDHD